MTIKTVNREPWPRTYLVSTFMTLEEIEARQAEPQVGLRNYVRLVYHTKYSGERYTDDSIPEIIVDAARAGDRLPHGWDSDSAHVDWLDGFVTDDLPVSMRADILDAVERFWCPSNHTSTSEWIGGKEGADLLFEEFPELLMAFTCEAREVGATWLARQI